MRPAPLLAALALAASTAACAHEHEPEEPVNCATETRKEEFVAGITKAGEDNRLSFTIVSAVPAVPARFNNTWVLELTTTGAAAPVSNASLTVSPWMPDHMHPGSMPVDITPLAEPGRYELDPVYVSMPGLWEFTIESPGAAGDRTVFRFCIPI